MTALQPIHVARLAERNGWRREQMGESVDGLPLHAWWPTGVPTRVIWAAIHGEETQTLLLTQHLLRTVHADDACAVVVPVLNPDGILLGTRQNANGVDLNRNFPTSTWSAATSPTYWPLSMVRNAASRTQLSSPGTEPGSEPETQAIIGLVERVQPTAVIDFHTPLECVIATLERADELAAHLAEPANLPIVRKLTAPTPGDSGRWVDENGMISITYEFELAPPPLLWHRHKEAMVRAVVDRLGPSS